MASTASLARYRSKSPVAKRVQSKSRAASAFPQTTFHDNSNIDTNAAINNNEGHYVSRRICVFRNGDTFYPGKRIIVSTRVFRNWEQFLHSVASQITLTSGAVRKLYDVNGKRVTQLDHIKDGEDYIASGNEPFKNVKYPPSLVSGESAQRVLVPPGMTKRQMLLKSRPSSGTLERNNSAAAGYSENDGSGTTRKASQKKPILGPTSKAFKTHIFANGDAVNPGLRFVINSRNCRTFEQLLLEISRALKIHALTPVHKLYDGRSGNRIIRPDQLKDGQWLVATTGREALRRVEYFESDESVTVHHRKSGEAPRVVTFFPNGDAYNTGVKVALKEFNYPDLEKLMSSLDHQIALITGKIKRICSLGGLTMTSIDALEHRGRYVVVAGNEPFVKMRYNINATEKTSSAYANPAAGSSTDLLADGMNKDNTTIAKTTSAMTSTSSRASTAKTGRYSMSSAKPRRKAHRAPSNRTGTRSETDNESEGGESGNETVENASSRRHHRRKREVEAANGHSEQTTHGHVEIEKKEAPEHAVTIKPKKKHSKILDEHTEIKKRPSLVLEGVEKDAADVAAANAAIAEERTGDAAEAREAYNDAERKRTNTRTSGAGRTTHRTGASTFTPEPRGAAPGLAAVTLQTNEQRQLAESFQKTYKSIKTHLSDDNTISPATDPGADQNSFASRSAIDTQENNGEHAAALLPSNSKYSDRGREKGDRAAAKYEERREQDKENRSSGTKDLEKLSEQRSQIAKLDRDHDNEHIEEDVTASIQGDEEHRKEGALQHFRRVDDDTRNKNGDRKSAGNAAPKRVNNDQSDDGRISSSEGEKDVQSSTGRRSKSSTEHVEGDVNNLDTADHETMDENKRSHREGDDSGAAGRVDGAGNDKDNDQSTSSPSARSGRRFNTLSGDKLRTELKRSNADLARVRAGGSRSNLSDPPATTLISSLTTAAGSTSEKKSNDNLFGSAELKTSNYVLESSSSAGGGNGNSIPRVSSPAGQSGTEGPSLGSATFPLDSSNVPVEGSKLDSQSQN